MGLSKEIEWRKGSVGYWVKGKIFPLDTPLEIMRYFHLTLIDKIRFAVGDRDGSQGVTIAFDNDETELHRQFIGVCQNIGDIFSSVVNISGGRI